MGGKEATCEEPHYLYSVSQQTGQENPHAPAHHEAVLKKILTPEVTIILWHRERIIILSPKTSLPEARQQTPQIKLSSAEVGVPSIFHYCLAYRIFSWVALGNCLPHRDLANYISEKQ